MNKILIKLKIFIRPIKIFFYNFKKRYKYKYTLINFKNFEMILDIYEYTQFEIAKGTYEKEIISFLKKNIHSSDNLVDVGSNVGFFTLIMAKCANNGIVYSIEPLPENQKILKKNIKLNNIKNVINYNTALSNENKSQKLIINPFNQGGNFINGLEKDFDYSSFSSMEIDTYTLDNLLKEKKIQGIKIDVEGYEIKVLEGMKKLIYENPPNFIIIETLENPEEIFIFLNKAKYYPLDKNYERISYSIDKKILNTIFVYKDYKFKN